MACATASRRPRASGRLPQHRYPQGIVGQPQRVIAAAHEEPSALGELAHVLDEHGPAMGQRLSCDLLWVMVDVPLMRCISRLNDRGRPPPATLMLTSATLTRKENRIRAFILRSSCQSPGELRSARHDSRRDAANQHRRAHFSGFPATTGLFRRPRRCTEAEVSR